MKTISNIFKKKRTISFQFVISSVGLIMLVFFSFYFASYISFGSNTQEVVIVQTQEISKQIVYNYENYISSIISTSNSIQVSLGNSDIVAEKDDIADDFQTIVDFSNEITGIEVYSTNGVCLVSNDNTNDGQAINTSVAWFNNAISDDTIHHFSSLQNSENDEYVVIVSKYITYGKNYDEAVLKISIDIENLIDLFYKSNLGEDGHIVIIDNSYASIYSSDVSVITEDLIVLKEIKLGSNTMKRDGSLFMVSVDTISNTQWRIATFININQIQEIQNNYVILISIISIIILSISVFVLLGIAGQVTAPLKQLEKEMLKIEKNDYFAFDELEFEDSVETSNLSHSFNKMMNRIKELMDKVIEEQMSQRKSELKALQNQINPHFLYNTLDSIVWLTENNKNKEASEMVVALAKFFRISISRGKFIIPVRDELEHARNYLVIQSIRYNNAFKYDFDIDEKVYKYNTMKLILQPLIENAIYHGLKNHIDEGFIHIVAKMKEDKLVLIVKDNGLGMRPEKIQELYKNLQNPDLNDGVGLKNIYQRLLIYFGPHAELLITSELDVGTTITLTIPTMEGEDNDKI